MLDKSLLRSLNSFTFLSYKQHFFPLLAYWHALFCVTESPPPPYSRLSPNEEHKPLGEWNIWSLMFHPYCFVWILLLTFILCVITCNQVVVQLQWLDLVCFSFTITYIMGLQRAQTLFCSCSGLTGRKINKAMWKMLMGLIGSSYWQTAW